jgi:2-(1,2-epoxy-1,2-dihydrophenyl)acetyl-CoA isomerase
MTEWIQLATRDGIATITLNRPEKLNSFADDMREQLIGALERVSRSEARVLVITGAGRGFCAGGDVNHMVGLKQRNAGFEEMLPLLEAGRSIVTLIHDLPIPTIAAVNGVAAGAGANLALACDLRIASDKASFGETFVKIGLHPDWGGTYFLPRLVGMAKALEMCWLGDVIDAAEAHRIGLVNRVIPDAGFVREVQALAGRLAAAPVTTVRAIRRSIRTSSTRSLEQCHDAEATAQESCWASPDSGEGLRAFVEKRAARFGEVGVMDSGYSSRSPGFE